MSLWLLWRNLENKYLQGPGSMRSAMASGPNSGKAKTVYYIPKKVSTRSCRSRRNCSVRKQLLQVRRRRHLPCHSPSRPPMTKLLSLTRQRKTLKKPRYHQQPRLTLLETRPLPLTPHYGSKEMGENTTPKEKGILKASNG